MRDEFDRPCYVIGDKLVTYEDDWAFGKSRVLGSAGDDSESRELIKADIREQPQRNGLPLYYVSDHGNVHKSRAIRLRKI